MTVPSIHAALADGALADRLERIAEQPRTWSAADRASLLREAAGRLRRRIEPSPGPDPTAATRRDEHAPRQEEDR